MFLNQTLIYLHRLDIGISYFFSFFLEMLEIKSLLLRIMKMVCIRSKNTGENRFPYLGVQSDNLRNDSLRHKLVSVDSSSIYHCNSYHCVKVFFGKKCFCKKWDFYCSRKRKYSDIWFFYSLFMKSRNTAFRTVSDKLSVPFRVYNCYFFHRDS